MLTFVTYFLLKNPEALRKLRVQGGCPDLFAFVSHTHAPHLRELELPVKG